MNICDSFRKAPYVVQSSGLPTILLQSKIDMPTASALITVQMFTGRVEGTSRNLLRPSS